eukprot:m.16435 g.16435  ORF g.16435 m.16435 type:complete len:1032 (-) comp10956_c0_seq4:250-3345(-)
MPLKMRRWSSGCRRRKQQCDMTSWSSSHASAKSGRRPPPLRWTRCTTKGRAWLRKRRYCMYAYGGTPARSVCACYTDVFRLFEHYVPRRLQYRVVQSTTLCTAVVQCGVHVLASGGQQARHAALSSCWRRGGLQARDLEAAIATLAAQSNDPDVDADALATAAADTLQRHHEAEVALVGARQTHVGMHSEALDAEQVALQKIDAQEAAAVATALAALGQKAERQRADIKRRLEQSIADARQRAAQWAKEEEARLLQRSNTLLQTTADREAQLQASKRRRAAAEKAAEAVAAEHQVLAEQLAQMKEQQHRETTARAEALAAADASARAHANALLEKRLQADQLAIENAEKRKVEAELENRQLQERLSMEQAAAAREASQHQALLTQRDVERLQVSADVAAAEGRIQELQSDGKAIDQAIHDAKSTHAAATAAHSAVRDGHVAHAASPSRDAKPPRPTNNSPGAVSSPGRENGNPHQEETGNQDRSDGPPVMSHALRRAGSNSSLVSVAPGSVYSKDAVSGMVHLTMQFEPTPGGMSPRSNRAIGVVKVHVSECRHLQASQPYVKLYISNQSQDLKSTKRKTKSKKAASPVFNESFEFPIKSESELDDSRRLQLSVWDHARLRANECTGGMSFSLAEIASSSQISGWFELLSTTQGRTRSERVAIAPDQTGDVAAAEPMGAVVVDTSAQDARSTPPSSTPAGSPSTNCAKTETVGAVSSSPDMALQPPDAVPAGVNTVLAVDDGHEVAAVRAEITEARERIAVLVEELRVVTEQRDDTTVEKAEVEKALAERTAELWALMETNAAHIGKLSEVTAENVSLRHQSLDMAGIKLRIGTIIKPPTGSLGLEISNDPQAKYTGVRISHVTAHGPASGGDILPGDVLIAVNGELVLGCSFDEVIRAISNAGTVIVLSLAAGSAVDAPGSPFWDDDGGETDCDDSLLSMVSGTGNDSIDMSALDRSDVSRGSSGNDDVDARIDPVQSAAHRPNAPPPSQRDSTEEPFPSPYAEEASYPPRRQSADGPRMTPTGGAVGWI